MNKALNTNPSNLKKVQIDPQTPQQKKVLFDPSTPQNMKNRIPTGGDVPSSPAQRAGDNQDIYQKYSILKEKLKQKEDKILILNSQLKNEKQERTEQVNELTSKIKILEIQGKRTNERLESEFMKLEQENSELQASIGDFKSLIVDKDKQISLQYETTNNNNSQRLKQEKSLSDQLELIKKESNQWQKKHSELQIENQSIQKQLAIKTKQLEEKDTEINSLQKEKEANKQFLKKIELQNLNTLQQIQDYIKILNPTTNVDNSQVEFIKNYTQILQNPMSEKEKTQLKNESDKITAELIKSTTKAAANSDPKSPTQSSKGVLLMKQLLQSNGITAFITNQSLQDQQQQNKGNSIQQQILGTGQIDNNKYYSINISQNSQHYQGLQTAVQSQQSMSQFSSLVKQIIGTQLGLQSPDDNITLLRVQAQPIPLIDFKINDQQISNEQIKIKMTSFDDMGLSLSVKNLLEYAKLSVDMFEPQFNMYWDDSYKGRREVRGSLKFHNNNDYSPQLYNFPVGFQGLALKVLDKYGQDKRWLNSNGDPTTWICLFHGTSDKYIESILKTNLKGGHRHLFAGSTCRITNEKITSNPNVYLSDSIDVAQSYCLPDSEFDGKKYYIVFQCRVNPKGVKSPQTQPDYYTVEDPANDIRPYRILYKEVQKS